MANLRDLAKQIETHKLADSKGPELKGKNVRGPSLKPGQIYLGRTWKTTVEDSDNVFLALRFMGSGTGKERKMYEENPRLIDMKEGDFYLFERFSEGRINELSAFQADDCLCFGDPPVRLTFFEIKDVTDVSKPEKPVSDKKSRKSADPAPAKAKKASSSKGKKSADKAADTKSAEVSAGKETAADDKGSKDTAAKSATHDEAETGKEDAVTGDAEPEAVATGSEPDADVREVSEGESEHVEHEKADMH